MFILDVVGYRGKACAVPFHEICFLVSSFFFFFFLPYPIKVIQDMKRKRQFLVYGKHSINVYLSLLHFLSDLPVCRAICLLIHLRLLL